jgi:uncharacterized YigZ family protein
MIAVAMAKHLTLAGHSHLEVDPIKRSRFIACGAPVSSVDAAQAFVASVRAKYADAGHHCFAWRLGKGDTGFRVSDDGEPGGTAGMPILNHIDGAGLGNVVIVVVRYFGGTKLGKGGLIRAYGGTAGELIRSAEVIEVEETSPLHIACSYSDHGAINSVLRQHGLSAADSSYGDRVELTVHVPVEQIDSIRLAMTEATAGRAIVTTETLAE